jgi:hypothetical protein
MVQETDHSPQKLSPIIIVETGSSGNMFTFHNDIFGGTFGTPYMRVQPWRKYPIFIHLAIGLSV